MLTQEQREQLCAPYGIGPNYTRFALLPETRKGNIALYAIGVTYIIISTIRFLYYRRIYLRLQKRNLLLHFIITLGCFIQFTGGVLGAALDYECWINHLLLVLVVPVTALPVFIQLLDYFNRYVLAQLLLDTVNSPIQDENTTQSRSEAINLVWALVVKGKLDMFESQKNPKANANQVDLVASPSGSIVGIDSITRNTSIAIESSNHSRSNITQNSIRLLKFLTSNRMRLIIFFTLLIPFLIMYIIDLATRPCLNLEALCHACDFSFSLTLTIAIGGFIVISLSIFFAYRVRTYPDPFGLLRECWNLLIYGACIALLGFACHMAISDFTFPGFSFGWVVFFGFFNIQFIITDLQIFTAQRDKAEKKIQLKRKGQRKKTTNFEAGSSFGNFDTGYYGEDEDGKVNTPQALKALLENPYEREVFEKHLVAEFAVESITMYMDCESFKKGFFDMNEGTRRARVKRIVDKHVSDDAVMQVNLPYATRIKLIAAANDTSRNVDIDMFEDALKEVFGMLLGSYQRYVRSNLYKETHPSIAT